MHIFSFTSTFSWHMHAHIHRHTCLSHARTYTRSNATVVTGFCSSFPLAEFPFPLFSSSSYMYIVYSFLFSSFSCLFLVFFLVASYARVITTRLICLERTVCKQWLVFAHCSLKFPMPLSCELTTIRKLKYKTNQFLNVQQREGDIFHDQSSFVLWTVFFSFLFFFFF